jgi:hypothetical protein
MLAVELLVNAMRVPTKPLLGTLLLAIILCGGRLLATIAPGQPVITSLSLAGTNLVFQATIPSDVTQAILEIRPTLTTPWQDAASLEVPASGGAVEFVIPKPTWDSAFFRLRTTTGAIANAQLSTELQYVTIPPLGPDAAGGTEAVFHFQGKVDGSDRIILTRQGAFWEHVNWDWPAGAVTVNGTQWNPREKNYLTTTGAVTFLPETYSLETVRLEPIVGRDIMALERTNHALIIYLNDTPSGAAAYEFKIHFRPATENPVSTAPSPAATLKIAAAIDGSDTLKITAREAVWQHRAYSPPWDIRLNDVTWDVRRTNTLVNAGPNTFLSPEVNLATARILNRKGRDLVTLWAEADALWINFGDNPNGADSYELEIGFGK